MEFRLLGPVRALRAGTDVPLGGPKQRALLAMLLLHANEVVARDALIDALWGERPPPSAHHTLDNYVSRLRKTLGAERLIRRPPGYELRVHAEELDVARFDALVGVAREAVAAGDAPRAASTLRRALAMWEGRPLGDVLYEPFAAAEAARLDERRLTVLEERVDAELAAGLGSELVPELEGLVAEHPLRERLIGQLALALYRAGRQADALAGIQAARRRLVAELGLDPGPQLRDLERRILRHDPTLAPAQPQPQQPRRPATRRRRTPFGVGPGLALGLVGVALAAGVLAGATVTKARGADLIVIRGGADAGATAVASGAGAVWVADPVQSAVLRLAPGSGVVADRIPMAGGPASIAVAGGAVWAADSLGGTVVRIDPRADTVTATVRLPGAHPSALAAGGGSLWVADATDRSVVEVDTARVRVARTIGLDILPTAVAARAGTLWIADYTANVIEEMDARAGKTIARIDVGNGPTAIAVGPGAVWVANGADGTVSRIDPRRAAVVATVAVGDQPSAIAVAGASAWVASEGAATVSRIDTLRNTVVETRQVDVVPRALAGSSRRVWVAGGSSPSAHRGGTLRLVATQPLPPLDPAFQDVSPTFGRLAYDTLVTLQSSPGPAGLRLVPDLARAVPEATRGGLAYVFRLRNGVRYSDGRRVRARDFRRAVERLFRLDSPGASLFSGLVGAESCLARPTTCDLARGIETDERTRTVSFRLRDVDPDFLYKIAVIAYSAPVPGRASRDLAVTPGTGPYRVAHVSRHEVRFVRNPYFHEWSHVAQPDGIPDSVVWRSSGSPGRAVEAVASGRDDWLLGWVPPAELRALRVSHAAQLHVSDSYIVDFIPLNTRLAPFDDIRVRRGFNLAIDRREIVRIYGGADVARPICQPLAHGLAGFRRYCPYTRHPRADGRWTAPDLARARRLVAASGTRGERVDVWAADQQLGIPPALAPYVTGVLRSLGYRARLHRVPLDWFTPERRRRLQLTVDGDWLADYPSASAYLPGFFDCHGGHNRKRYVCDPQLDRRMRAATALASSDPARAAAAWTAIDRELTDRAYWVATVSVRAVELVSPRLRNYQFNPVWGFIADQAWLR